MRRPSAPPLDRRDALWFGVVFVVAFALRWAFVHQLRAYPWFDAPQVDEGVHHEWALAVARGEPWAEPPFFRAPLYPWFLGALYSLLGPDLYLARVAQGALGALTCGLVYLAGRLAFRRAVGVAAGLAAATYWVLLYFDASLLIPVLSGFLHLLLICALLVARDRPSPWIFGGAGLAMGLAAIARPNVLLFAPAAAVWAMVRARRAGPAPPLRPGARARRAPGLLAAGALAAGTLLPIAPVTWINAAKGGDLVLVSSQGGVNFHIGNRPGADGISVSLPGEANEWDAWYAEQRARAEEAAGRPLRPSEISAWYASRAWSFLLGSPGESLPLLGRKAVHFLSRREIPNNQDPHFVVEEYVPLARWLPLGFWIVGPLGLLGVALTLRRGDLFPLWGFVLVYSLSVIAFFVTGRFRVPIVPPLIVLGCHAVDWLAGAARERRWRPLALAAAGLVLVAWPVSRVPASVDTLGILPRRTMGLWLHARGDSERAEPLLGEVVRLAATAGLVADPPTWCALGGLRAARGDGDGAQRAFRNALARDPRFAPAWLGLARLAEREGDWDRAGQRLLQALRSDAAQGPACARFAERLSAAGHVSAAMDFARAALEVVPGDRDLAATLAELRRGLDGR